MSTDATPTINSAFNKLSTATRDTATQLNLEIQGALTGGDLDPMAMLDLQFKMGKFNAMIEATSSVTKGLTDTAKTLAQRAGG